MPTYIVGGWHEPRKYLVLEKAGKRRKAWLNTSLILILCCSQMRGSPMDLDYNTFNTHIYTSPMIILETWRINRPLLICILVSRRTKLLLIFLEWNHFPSICSLFVSMGSNQSGASFLLRSAFIRKGSWWNLSTLWDESASFLSF